MAEYIPKTDGAQNLPTQESYLNPGNDSSAKKFITTNAIENNSPIDGLSNIGVIIEKGAAAKSLAMSVQNIAADALRQISSAEAAILQVDGVQDIQSRQNMVDFNESDVNSIQRTMAKTAGVNFNFITDVNMKSMLSRQTQNFIFDSRHAFTPIKQESAQVLTTNLIVPEIEEVTVDIDKNAGAIDNFYVSIGFNLPASKLAGVKAVRVFRAEMDSPIYSRPLSTLSPNGIQRLQTFRGRKNEDPSQRQMQLNEDQIPNSVSSLNYFDPFTGDRVSAVGTNTLIISPPVAGQNANPLFLTARIPIALQHLDTSVLQDINTISNIKKNPVYGYDVSVDTSGIIGGQNVNTGLKLGNQAQIDLMGNKSDSKIIVDKNNKLDFQCISTFSPGNARMNPRRVSDRCEFYFTDESVRYGRGYKYFIVTIDNQMIQSARSIIATTVVEGLRVPERPATVSADINQTSVSLTITVADQLVEKFEVYRFEDSLDRKQTVVARTLADQEGFTARSYVREISENNYLLIGECMNPPKAGAQFVDRSVIPGRHYIYRVYSVDIFGNKSESPFQEEVFIPDLEQQFVDLRAPSILVEVDATTHYVRITFSCDDEHVERLRLDRRDLTIGQVGFATPGESPRIQFGMGRVKGRKGLEGEHLYDSDQTIVWNGIFKPIHHQQQVFIDKSAALDHVYQYRMFGEDRYGNKTSYALSSPLLVSRRPLVNAPVGLSASVVYDQENIISGINVQWVESNIDISADELMASQTALADTSVRTLYQLQRQKRGEQIWRNFALQSGTTIFDPLVGVESQVAPNFRPPYVDANQVYFYRVQAVQTGAFISNFSFPIQVFAGYGAGQPRNFTVRTPDSYTRPFYAMLNWDTQANSGIVDRWEIQRDVVNNFAADRLNLKNPEDFQNLLFESFRIVYRESSRFSSKVQDAPNASEFLSNIIVGEHYYMDTQVDFGNTYFYRIRAITPEGYTSTWSYRALKITSPVFEQKWVPTLTDAEKSKLSTSYEPLYFINGRDPTGKNTFSLLPDYSKPDWNRTVPRIAFTVE